MDIIIDFGRRLILFDPTSSCGSVATDGGHWLPQGRSRRLVVSQPLFLGDESDTQLAPACPPAEVRMTRATPDQVRKRYAALQSRLKSLFQRIKDDTLAPRTVVVVPSLSLDPQVLATIGAASHYEERMLSMLMLLRMPRTRVVFLTSTPLAPSIVDYYLHLLSGVPTAHARARLTLLSANDASRAASPRSCWSGRACCGGFVTPLVIQPRRICRFSMRRIWSAIWRWRSISRSMDATRNSCFGERRAAAAPRFGVPVSWPRRATKT